MKLIDAAALSAKMDAEIADAVRELNTSLDTITRAEYSGLLDGLRTAYGIIHSMPAVDPCPPPPPRNKGGRKPEQTDRVREHLVNCPEDAKLTAQELANRVGVGRTSAAKVLAGLRTLDTVNGK